MFLIGWLQPFAEADHSIPREKLPKNWQADADLNDVFFLDQNLGWAVGSQGTILRTIDGGRSWTMGDQTNSRPIRQLALDEKIRAMQNGIRTASTGVANGSSVQHQPFRCRFESVFFIDKDHGWVAGGYDVPYMDRSRAVVLRTSDGGTTWQSVDDLVIPRIKKIHFDDASNGWAIGETGNLFPTGIYFTSDGGITWSSQSSGEMSDWIDGCQISTGFVNIDSASQLAIVKNNQLEKSVILADNRPRLRQVNMIDAQQGWAVGDNNAIFNTTNEGLSWKPVRAPQLDQLGTNINWKTISASDGKVWIAGCPGSRIVSIDQQTGDAEIHATGVSLPIHRVHFVDDQTGWAVGALGTILSTSDGGKTWQRQRGDHTRVAVLAVALNEPQLPFELMALQASEENRICVAATCDTSVSEMGRQATERLGCSSITALDLQPGQSNSNMEKMVRAIRIFRPTVIVCNASLADVFQGNNGGVQFDPIEFFNKCIVAATDPNEFSFHLDRGLRRWQVDRLAVLDRQGELRIHAERMLPRMGIQVEDQVALSRALLNLPLTSKKAVAYRVQNFSGTARNRDSDLMGGLAQSGRAVPTRHADTSFRGNLHAIQLANSKQSKLEEFTSFQLRDSQDYQVWQQQVLSWTLSLDQQVAGIWLVQLAQNYLSDGKTELASHTLEILATRLSGHALAPAAMEWLASAYGCDELGHLAIRKQKQNSQSPNFYPANGGRHRGDVQQGPLQSSMSQVQSGGVTQVTWTPEPTKVSRLEPATEKNNEADATNEIPVRPFLEFRWQTAGRLLSLWSQHDPDQLSSHRYRSLAAHVQRKLNGTLAAESLFQKMIESDKPGIETGNPVIAQRELALAKRDSTVGLSSIRCPVTTNRPQLDGRIDEPFWQQQLENKYLVELPCTASDSTARINDANAPPVDLAMFAHDETHFYAVFHCQKIPDQYYQSDPSPRPRDANLARHDRVAFSLDIDRDYGWAWEFEVDHRGWVRESCGGALNWNPKWFVAQSETDRTWTIELAIPLDELTPVPVSEDSVWAIRLERKTWTDDNLWNDNHRAADNEPTSSMFGTTAPYRPQPATFELLEFK